MRSQLEFVTDGPLAEPPAPAPAQRRRGVTTMLRSIGDEFAARIAERRLYRLSTVDAAVFKDIGVSRGGLDRAIRCGRS
jgi:hypothetical protein